MDDLVSDRTCQDSGEEGHLDGPNIQSVFSPNKFKQKVRNTDRTEKRRHILHLLTCVQISPLVMHRLKIFYKSCNFIVNDNIYGTASFLKRKH